MNKKKQHIPQSIPSPSERARVRLKICGMKYQDNIQQVAALQPDYLGFIFYEKSARFLEGDVIPELPKSTKKVGVFVNAPLKFVVEKINQLDLQAVQLHGKESPEYCLKLKRHYEEEQQRNLSNRSLHEVRNDKDLKIIKVFSIKDEFDFGVLKPYEDAVDYFLFDTKGKLPGGNGYTFNWNVLNDYPSTKPFFLSGGIGIDEIEKIKTFQQSKASKYCHVLDVNSKFEIEPGLKNIEVLKEFKEKLEDRS